MGADPPRTLWVWLTGDFTPLEVREDADAYQLFVARSAALGWLSDAPDPTSRGLWSMNDAATGTTPATDRAGWFQVAVESPTAVAPVAQLLSCVEAVTVRLLDLDLRGVQLVLPTAGPDRATEQIRVVQRRLAQTAFWIDDDPHRPMVCDITIGTPARGSLAAVFAGAPETSRALSHGAVVLRPATVLKDVGAAEPSGLDPHVWGGPVHQAVAMRGELGRWTFDAMAWTIELIVLLCVQAGLTDPMTITIDQAGPLP
jgi:hypothetical protein